MSTVPQPAAVPGAPGSDLAEKIRCGAAYAAAGLHVFVVRETKHPLRQCSPCSEAGPEHDPEACDHLVCHAFYAASADPDRVRAQVEYHPGGLLALRTGRPSGLVVIDLEASADGPDEPTGLEVCDRWEEFTGGVALPDTLAARTGSGGLHLLYRYGEPLASHNRVLPSVDLKADGGYVVLPPGPGRRWTNGGPAAALPEELAEWLRGRTGRSARRGPGGANAGSRAPVGHRSGYDYREFIRSGCPVGWRDEFLNDLAFRLRKAGVGWDDAVTRTREAWSRLEQPEDAFFRWEWVEYKLRNVWRRVEPEELPRHARRWVESRRAAVGREPDLRPSRATFVRPRRPR